MKLNIIILALMILGVTPQVASAWGGKGDFQKNLCHVKDGDQANQQCKNGDTMLYTPASFGNEQLPIMIASLFCDFEHPIVYNKGAVSCIFSDIRKKNWEAFGVKTNKTK